MYLGNQPALSYTSFAKQDFTTSATTSYTLDHPVTNENEIALFINFVRQEPTTAYSASGTSLTLTSATSASDDMYCVFLGKAVQTVNPPNSSVGSSQVSADLITGQTAETSIATDDTVLIHDTSAGALRKMTRANFVSGVGGITEIDYWVLTSTLNLTSANTNTDLTSNWSRYTQRGSNYKGTGMSESSGIFTFPSTGYYRIEFSPTFSYNNTNSNYVLGRIMTTTDNSTYNDTTEHAGQIANSEMMVSLTSSMIFDVTDTSTHKVKFLVHTRSANVYVSGNSTKIRTYASFIRLGDT